jgi:hypothetical protein
MRCGWSSTECGLVGATAVLSSPRLHRNEEGVSAVLIEVFSGQGDDGGRPVTKRRKQRCWNLVLGDWGCREVKQGATRGVVRCRSTKGAFYRLGEAVEGKGGGRPARLVLISSVLIMNQGGKWMRCRASAGE